jgi:hypothetical protein
MRAVAKLPVLPQLLTATSMVDVDGREDAAAEQAEEPKTRDG